MRILKEDTMAIIIDFQERLVPAIYNNEQLIKNNQILIQGLNALNIPMVVTQQYTKGIGMTVEEIKCNFLDEFEYFDKVTFSCVDDEQILSKVQEIDKKNIIVCGVEAHVCVLQTVIDLKEKGYNVILVQDCIGSRKENDKLIGIERAANEGAVISTYESILFELTRKAGNDTFKTISKLVK